MKEQGDRCLDNGDWSGAAAYYQQAIVIDSQFVEVAETIYYGLKKLSKKAAISYNTYGTKGKNIILGSNLLSPKSIPFVPENSIIYNLEQVYSSSP